MQHILIIDGEAAQRAMLVKAISSRLGYRAGEMGEEAEPLAYAHKAKPGSPDLVLIDVATLHNGVEAVRQLAAHMPHCPVITLVKYGDYAQAMQCIMAGAHDFLVKPVAEERLRITLRNALIYRDEKLSQLVRMSPDTMAAPIGSWPQRGSHGNLQPMRDVLVGSDGHVRPFNDIELDIIEYAMQHYNSRMIEVARRLGIGRSTLYRKLSYVQSRRPQRVAEAL